LQSAGTTAVTIDTSQKVGINTTSPNTGGNLTIKQSSSAYQLQLEQSNTTDNFSLRCDSNDGALTFSRYQSSAYTERMRLTLDGNFLVGGTSVRDSGKVSIDTSGNGLAIYVIPNTSAVDFAIFRANSGTLCGAISRVGTTGAVTYTSTSDYRLKENITPMTGALNKIARLKPVTYTWKNGGQSAEGFIAHELAEVCPDAVVGAKDQLDADGNPKYQGIDVSFLVATLTAAIQELSAKNDALTARIVALEAK
jgi:hypothetical protein